MAYTLTPSEVQSLIDLIEETTDSADRTPDEANAHIKLIAIRQAQLKVHARNRGTGDERS